LRGSQGDSLAPPQENTALASSSFGAIVLVEKDLEIPQGTRTVDLAYVVQQFNAAGQQENLCNVYSRTIVPDISWRYYFVLNGAIIWSGSGSSCNTQFVTFRGEGYNSTQWIGRRMDVSAATALYDGFLQIFAMVAGSANQQQYDAVVSAGASLNSNNFLVNPVQPRDKTAKHLPGENDATAQSAFSQNDATTRRFLGVPSPGKGTYRPWGLTFTFAPATATILAVAPFAEGTVSGQAVVKESLTSDPFTIDPGGAPVVYLSNVGFSQSSSSRILWWAKASEVRIGVSVSARLADGTQVQRTVYLAKLTDASGLQSLVPLYDASDIPGASTRRFGTRDAGGDAWSTAATYSFIAGQLNSDPWFLFNDVSLEHGGPWWNQAHTELEHANHRHGVEVDARYFGTAPSAGLPPGGLGLNGTREPKGLDDTGQMRLAALKAARTAQIANQTSDPNWIAIVKWIRDNRDAIDCLTGQNPDRPKQITYSCAAAYDPGITSILIGRDTWNRRSLIEGFFDLGDGGPVMPINDPNPANPSDPEIRDWSNGKVRLTRKHLDHVHIWRNQ
jgi:hypothetical protein